MSNSNGGKNINSGTQNYNIDSVSKANQNVDYNGGSSGYSQASSTTTKTIDQNSNYNQQSSSTATTTTTVDQSSTYSQGNSANNQQSVATLGYYSGNPNKYESTASTNVNYNAGSSTSTSGGISKITDTNTAQNNDILSVYDNGNFEDGQFIVDGQYVSTSEFRQAAERSNLFSQVNSP